MSPFSYVCGTDVSLWRMSQMIFLCILQVNCRVCRLWSALSAGWRTADGWSPDRGRRIPACVAPAPAPTHRATAVTPQLSRLIAAITLTGLGPTKDNTAIQLYTYVVCSSSAQAKLRNNNQTVFTPLQDEL